MKICNRENRPRPMLITPAKGTEGDCTDETMAGMCDINRIIQRYGGNLAELAAWRGSMSYGEQPPDNLEDALVMLNNAKDICNRLGVDSISDALTKLNNPTTDESSNVEIVKKEVSNEKTENQPETIEKNLPENSQQS